MIDCMPTRVLFNFMMISLIMSGLDLRAKLFGARLSLARFIIIPGRALVAPLRRGNHFPIFPAAHYDRLVAAKQTQLSNVHFSLALCF